MDTAVVVARLKGELGGFNTIGGAADLDAAIERLPNTPAAFVLPLAEQGGKPQLLGQHSQRISKAFGVVLVVSNLQDATGAASTSELEVKRQAVLTALAGWSPNPPSSGPVAFTGGRLLRFDQGRLWWVDEFVFDDHFRKA